MTEGGVHVHRAERADALADALGLLLADPLEDPFATEVVAVPAKGVERWLAQRLSHRLGAWVGLVDVTGSLDREAPEGGLGQPSLGEVVGEARSMLRRGQRASWTIEAGESVGRPQRMTLQTLGGGGGGERDTGAHAVGPPARRAEPV